MSIRNYLIEELAPQAKLILAKMVEKIHQVPGATEAQAVTFLQAKLSDFFANSPITVRADRFLAWLANRYADGTWDGLKAKALSIPVLAAQRWANGLTDRDEDTRPAELLLAEVQEAPDCVSFVSRAGDGPEKNFITEERYSSASLGVTVRRLSNPKYNPETKRIEPNVGPWEVV